MYEAVVKQNTSRGIFVVAAMHAYEVNALYIPEK